VLSLEARSRSAIQEFPNIYGIRKFITFLQQPAIGPYTEPD
jgi:hypothetical protein